MYLARLMNKQVRCWQFTSIMLQTLSKLLFVVDHAVDWTLLGTEVSLNPVCTTLVCLRNARAYLVPVARREHEALCRTR